MNNPTQPDQKPTEKNFGTPTDQALVAAWMESLKYEKSPINGWRRLQKTKAGNRFDFISDEQATFFYQAHVAAVAEAKESVVFAIVSTKTEGIIDDGEVFIKQEPLNQTIVDIVGYEKFKTMQEAVNAPPKEEGTE